METYQKWVVSILSALLSAAIIITAIVAYTHSAPLNNGFDIPSFEKNAVSGSPDKLEGNMNYRTLKISDGFVISVCGNLTVDGNGNVDVYFTADQNNTVWTRLIILTEDGHELGSTGVLRANEYVKSVCLNTVPVNSTNVILKFLSYEPNSYYSMGTATAKITLNVS